MNIKLKCNLWIRISSGFILMLWMFITIYGQNDSYYSITGRVVDENGKAISKAGICVEPVNDNSTQFDRFIICLGTDTQGRFTKKIEKNKSTIGRDYFLFVNVDTNLAALTKIAPPFELIRQQDKTFDGKLIKLGNKNLIDLGDVQVQFWYGQVNLELNKAKKLKKIDWRSAVLQIRNQKGQIVYAGTLSKSDLMEYMDQKKSELRISLPEGTWKIEILGGFDELTLAESSFFVIERKKQPQKIIMSTKF